MSKRMPWSGWPKQKPSVHQRTVMLRKCGKKCFLGPNKSFPICKKNTCKISDKGIYAAYVRAREWRGRSPRHSRTAYYNIAAKAKRMLSRRGYKKVGSKSRRTIKHRK